MSPGFGWTRSLYSTVVRVVVSLCPGRLVFEGRINRSKVFRFHFFMSTKGGCKNENPRACHDCNTVQHPTHIPVVVVGFAAPPSHVYVITHGFSILIIWWWMRRFSSFWWCVVGKKPQAFGSDLLLLPALSPTSSWRGQSYKKTSGLPVSEQSSNVIGRTIELICPVTTTNSSRWKYISVLYVYGE